MATSVAILLMVSIVQRAIGFGRGVLFCRWLTPEELGLWEMAYSFLLLAAPITVLGVPGSVGRYLERYRQQGQLRTFLLRAVSWTALLTVLAMGIMLSSLSRFSQFILGRPDMPMLVALLAVSLGAVILHHFLEALFAALRMFRIVSMMHFGQSIGFATISLGMLYYLPIAAESIVFAYGLACLISAATTLLVMGRSLGELTDEAQPVAHRVFWPPLLRFAVWVWITNLLCHLFAVIDRYMIVHHSGLDNAAALSEVGNYHSSRVVPLLFISVADLLAGILLPYLSQQWEAGHRQAVVDRLNLVLKLTGTGMFAAAVAVLWAAPLLFHVAFEGKYDSGLAVLPWTLTCCILYALLLVTQTYVWCAERTRLSAIPLATGLVVNIGLNLVLLPMWGLLGAVVATTIATAVGLAVLVAISTTLDMHFQFGALLAMCVSAALIGGPWVATVVLLVFAVLIFTSEQVFSGSERREILAGLGGRLTHVLVPGPKPAIEPDSPGANEVCLASLATLGSERKLPTVPRSASRRGRFAPLGDRGPLRLMFVITSMPVGGAETLLVNLVRRLDPERFRPELCCLKERGPLGEELAEEFPVHAHLIAGKYDVRVLPRLRRLLVERHTDALITVGAGDKMFWGRLAARAAGVPVIASALHSTGWPDGIGWVNHRLTSITDAFIAVASSHGDYLIREERLPADKVRVIPNGVDTERFRPVEDEHLLRRDLGISAAAPVVAIVAALRPEKNHEMYLTVAERVIEQLPDAQFLIIGDGPRRGRLETLAGDLGIARQVHFLGSRPDVPQLLTVADVFALTSHNEANPVSILEAMSIGRPVVATDVGSVSESVDEGRTGYLVPAGDVATFAERVVRLLANPLERKSLGDEARQQVVAQWSVDAMVRGYESLVEDIYIANCGGTRKTERSDPSNRPAPVMS